MKTITIKIVLIFFAAFSSFAVFAQKKAQQSPKPAATSTTTGGALASADSAFWAKEYLLSYALYRNGLAYGDLAVAKHALFEMIAINPSNKNLRDSLMLVYFRLEAFPQALVLSKEILVDKPSDLLVMEVKAVSEQNLRLIKESLETYELLYTKSKDLYHLYQIGTLQFQLKRFGECNMTMNQLVKSEGSDKKEIMISNQNGQGQKVPIKAASYNILGVMALETSSLKEAKTFFEEALKVTPEFELAKGNLKVVDEKMKPKPTTPAPKK
jgi:tetratricopeptide (TPR) repeat protein